MNNSLIITEKIKRDSEVQMLKLVSLSYLILPVILFISCWFKIIIAIPTAIIVLIVCISYWKCLIHLSHSLFFELSIQKHILLPVFTLSVCLFSGVGGFVFQGDFLKHYAMLHDLVYMDWPVVYNQDTSSTFLNYYFAYFLPPAFLAKITSPDYIDNYIIIWTSIGLYLAFRWFIYLAGNKIIWISLFFLLFLGGQDLLYAALKFCLQSIISDNNDIAWQIFQQEIFTVSVFHNTILRYPTNFFTISWAPQHLIGAWLVTACLIENYQSKSDQKFTLFLSSLLPLWSVFNAIGILPIITGCIIKNRKGLLSWQNIIGGGVIIILTGFFFISHNTVNEQGWIWKYIPINTLFLKWFLFLFFEFGYIAFVVRSFILKSSWKYLYLSCLLFLSILPAYVLGYMNDLLMRAAVPSLFVFNLLACFYYQKVQNRYKKLVLGIVLLGVILPQLITISSHLPSFTKFHLENGFSKSRIRIKDSKSLIDLTEREWFNMQYFGKKDSFYFKYLAR